MVQEEDENALEIIFVSSDRDQKSFAEYHDSMSFVALPFSADDKKGELAERFGVNGIPMLVILDRDGKVVDANARATVMGANGNVSKALSKWSK
jgi:nucleoredoxin